MVRRGAVLCVSILMLGLPVLPAAAQPASEKIDYERMRQDLDVMETILKKLFSQLREESEILVVTPEGKQREVRAERFPIVTYLESGRVGSIYLDDFGVIFDIDYRSPTAAASWAALKLQQQLQATERMLQMRAWGVSRRGRSESEEGGTIRGKVTDEATGRPLQGAMVSADGFAAVTDAEGAFVFEGVAPGSYTVIVQAPGYKEAGRQKVSVAKGGRVFVTFSLESDKTIDRVKDQVLTFLSTYADAIGQIPPSQSIMVVVNFSGERFGGSPGEGEIERLEARVKKGDIIDYRRGAIDLDAFRKRVQFREVSATEADTDLDIFVEIMETVLDRRGSSRLRAREIRGFYLDDDGAVIILEARPGLSVFAPDVILRQEKEENAAVVSRPPRADVRAEREEEGETEAALEDFKQQIVEVLADFGHTLRRIPPAGWIAVVADVEPSGFFSGSDRRRLVCRVTKKDIDEYNRRRIDLAGFSKRATWREY